MPVGAGFTDIATDRKLRTTINSHAYAVEGIYYGLVLTAKGDCYNCCISKTDELNPP
jgi:hypothetical protein